MSKRRGKQRANRLLAGSKKAQEPPPKPSIAQLADGLIGIVIGLVFLYWFYTGMWAACTSWLP